MNKVTVQLPAGGLAGPLTRADAQLGVRSTRITVGSVTSGNGAAQVRFTVSDDLTSNHTWTYHGLLRLVNRNRRWRGNSSPAPIYPTLKPGQRVTLTTPGPARAPSLEPAR